MNKSNFRKPKGDTIAIYQIAQYQVNSQALDKVKYDEYQLMVFPIVLGSGKRLFKDKRKEGSEACKYKDIKVRRRCSFL